MRVLVRCIALAAAGSMLVAAPANARVPRGYTIVNSGPLFAANGHNRGSVDCPAGTVPLGGGVFTSSSSTSVAVGSSFPSSTGWVGELNNVTGAPTTFDITAVCARAPRRYQVVLVSPFTAPADTQASGTATCPAGTSVLGGGSIANTTSVAVNINSTFPTANGWRVDLNNNTTPATTFDVLAVCGKAPRGYAVVTGQTVTNPQFQQTIATVSCPAGTVPLSGGDFSDSGSPAVDLNSTTPTPSGWDVFENNGRTGDTAITAIAVCAA